MGLDMPQNSPTSSKGRAPSDGPKICIAGAGMGGLTCALALTKRGFKNIEVFEMASGLGFVGAGIQLAPNMARVLDRLGVWSDIEKEAVILHDTKICDGATGEELANVQLDYIHAQYGYYHQVGHRHSLANGIYQGCLRQEAIKFNFATTISDVKSFSDRPTFTATPRNGTPYTVQCDILLGCDGIKSQIRDKMLSELNVTDARVVDTNQSSYRIMLKREDMEKDPELLALINGDRVTRWIGPKRHIIAYPVSSKQIYNLSSAQPDLHFAAAPSATYTTKADKSSMLDTYKEFCPVVQKMLNLVPAGEVCEWKLRVHSPLPTWVCGSTALVGDACHPTLPHLAQGAAQAIEDASVIGVVLSKLTDFTPHHINRAFKVYEKVRKDRAEALVNMAAASGRELHLGEGEAKAARDAAFAALKAGKGAKVPDKWADADVQKIIYGVDCEKIADEQWEELFASV